MAIKMTPKRIVLTVALVAWLGFGAWLGPVLAGSIYLITHRTNPLEANDSTWQNYWHDYSTTDQKERKRLIGSAVVPFLFFLGVPFVIFLKSLNKPRKLHGDARWATADEVKEGGLFASEGVILGKLGGRYLMVNDAVFVLLCAPTRSGKGVGTIIPNLLNWNQSAITVDIKGENFDVTSKYRATHGQEVYKFAPFDEESKTHCWNPLSYISRDPKFMVGDIQSIGYMLYPQKDGPDGFWFDQARNLFVGLVLYCIEGDLPVTIGEALRRSSGDGKAKAFWTGIVEAGVGPNGKELSSDCLNSLRQFAANSENTLTSVLASFNAPLGSFANPLVDLATSSDEFDVRDIRRRPMSIYVVVPPNKLAEASLLVNLFFSITIDQNTKVLPEQDPSLKYKALLLLDEFPALGRVDKLAKSIGYIAGYGLRVLTITQSISQLQDPKLYGKEGTRNLVTNHLIQIMYAPREQEDAKEYSDILGYQTADGVSRGRSDSRGGHSSQSENVSEQRRALMLPQELREIGDDRIIVMAANIKPIFADKIRYYKDPAFTPRLLGALTVPAHDLDAFIENRKTPRRQPAVKPVEVVPAKVSPNEAQVRAFVADARKSYWEQVKMQKIQVQASEQSHA